MKHCTRGRLAVLVSPRRDLKLSTRKNGSRDSITGDDMLQARWLRPAFAESYRLLRVHQAKELVAVRL